MQLRDITSEALIFYGSKKFTVPCKVNKPVCEPPLKLTQELRKLKLDWLNVNSVIQCHLTVGKKHVFDARRILNSLLKTEQPISGRDIFIAASRHTIF